MQGQLLSRSSQSISEWFSPLLQVKALGCDGSSCLSSWLENLGLHEYLHNFLASGYRTLDCVKNLWELEIVNVSHDDVNEEYQRVKLVFKYVKENSAQGTCFDSLVKLGSQVREAKKTETLKVNTHNFGVEY